MTAARVIEVLDQTVDWQRTLGVQQKAANEPSDMMFFYDNRQTASKITGLAFDAARADADMLARAAASSGSTPEQTGAGAGTEAAQSVAQLRAGLDEQANSVKAELDLQRRVSDSPSRRSREQARAKVNELQGELDLLTTRQSILRTMSGFSANDAGQSAEDLRAQIDAIAAAIPSSNAAVAASGSATGAAATSAGPPAAVAALGHFGLWDLAAEVFRLSAKTGTIISVDERTADLQKTFSQIRSPLLAQIQALSAQGASLASKADSADVVALNAIHDQLDALAVQFKQASALLLPLDQADLLLGQYRRNLSNWRAAIKVQYKDALQSLAIRLGILLAVLALVFLGAEVWRRAVMHYIQDTRRRYQLLLLRRIVLWLLVTVVVGVAFATELGSIATFAGLITAGIAVAMQSVLVSIVGYFFLVGKYGIRVGDRIQIGDVAGEVIDQGLVRMYLMELGNKGMAGPTGRVVAFANSVVFQVSSGLFKQIPGVNFTWREVVLNLPTGANYAAVREKLRLAVTDALGDYRDEFSRQTREIERTTLSSYMADTRPEVHLQFATSGVEAHVRYPVQLTHAAEIDERVTEALSVIMSTVKASSP
jgi:small-conductance mechanosensitive channel